MGAEYSFEVKNIEIWAPRFFKHNNSPLATVPAVNTELWRILGYLQQKGSKTSILDSSDRQGKKKQDMQKNNQITWYPSNALKCFGL